MARGNKGKKKKQCIYCKTKFYAYPNQTWIVFCKNCHKSVYKPLLKKHTHSEIMQNLEELHEKHCAEVKAKFEEQLRQPKGEFDRWGYYCRPGEMVL